MAIYDLFSKRQKRLKGEPPSVYTFDEIPVKLRVQIVHILQDTIGYDREYTDQPFSQTAYGYIYDILCREYGRFSLLDNSREIKIVQVTTFFLTKANLDESLDFIELAFTYINTVISNYNQQMYSHYTGATLTAEKAIFELNHRFRENGFGYQFEGNKLIRLDSTYVHSEIAKPTIGLLWNKMFKGANEEYMKAHEHYRHGRNKECLTECLKAFESTMKIILKEKGWAFNQTDTSKKLIQICFQNNLIPSFSQNQFTSLQNLLESGIPTIRNKLSGHGQGQELQKVDDGITRYGLNLTGTNIIFLVEQSGIK